MLDLGRTEKVWGITSIYFEHVVSISALLDAAEKEGHYIISTEKTNLYGVRLKETGQSIAKVGTKKGICERMYFKDESSLPFIAEFDRRLSLLLPEEGEKLPEKPPEFKKIFDSDTRAKLHTIGTANYYGGSINIISSNPKSIPLIQKATLQTDCTWAEAEKRKFHLTKAGAEEPVAILKEVKKGTYHFFKQGEDKPCIIITFLDRNRQTIIFPNAVKNAELIKNFIHNITK